MQAQAEQGQQQESTENRASCNVDPIARLRVAQRSEAHVQRRQALQRAPAIRKQLETWTLEGMHAQVPHLCCMFTPVAERPLSVCQSRPWGVFTSLTYNLWCLRQSIAAALCCGPGSQHRRLFQHCLGPSLNIRQRFHVGFSYSCTEAKHTLDDCLLDRMSCQPA